MRVASAIAALKELDPNEYIAIQWMTRSMADRDDELNETEWVEVTDLAEGYEAETYSESIYDRVAEAVKQREDEDDTDDEDDA